MQLTGDLAKVSLPNLLQLVRNGELTGKIALSLGAKTATIYIDRGQANHVELDSASGRDALMELFLWGSGTFSFYEQDVTDVPRSLNPSVYQEDSLERLVRDGIHYQEQKHYLDEAGVTGQTVLIPAEGALHPQTWSTPERAVLFDIVEPVLTRIDGRKTLAEALADVSLSRRAFISAVYSLLAGGFASIENYEPGAEGESERVVLPPWVVARLRQDNSDLSQAIIDMVIWVDRVKCWMYQVDVDFSRILDEVSANEEVDAPDEDFFELLQDGSVDTQEPLFGEQMIALGKPEDSVPAPKAGAVARNSGSDYFDRTSGAPPDEAVPGKKKLSDPSAGASETIPGAKKPPSIEF